MSNTELLALWNSTIQLPENSATKPTQKQLIKLVQHIYDQFYSNKYYDFYLPNDDTWKQINENFFCWSRIWATVGGDQYHSPNNKTIILNIYSRDASNYASNYIYIYPDLPIIEIGHQIIKLNACPIEPVINSSILNETSDYPRIHDMIKRILDDEIPDTCYWEHLRPDILKQIFNSERTNKIILQALQYLLWKIRPVNWSPKYHSYFLEEFQQIIKTMLLLYYTDPLVSILPLEMLFEIFQYL